MKKEMRKFPRLDSKNLMSFDVLASDENYEGSDGIGLTKDVSLGGISIEIDRELQKDSIVSIQMALKENIVNAQCEAKHIKPLGNGMYSIGLKFKKISQKDLNLLLDHFDRR